MSTHTSVEVFLGNSITIASEQRSLVRSRRDLLGLGVSARILASLQLGYAARQVDFVVVTDDRVVRVEFKTFPGPVVARERLRRRSRSAAPRRPGPALEGPYPSVVATGDAWQAPPGAPHDRAAMDTDHVGRTLGDHARAGRTPGGLRP